MRRWWPGIVLGVVLVALVGGIALGLRTLRALEEQVEARFQGRLFAVPSRVYSAPLVLYPGLHAGRAGLRERLERLHYHPPTAFSLELASGEYREREGRLHIFRRPFRYPHREDPGGPIRLDLGPDGVVERIRDPDGLELDTASLEPELIAELHGASREDRRLARLADLPSHLVDAVLAIEDQRFHEHRGIDPRRIGGAFAANLRAGRVVQGGSTLTQQLVKNFYLTRRRTLGRKLREAVMALLLERNHSKEEILEAYLNEVYMGQRGSVAIHGMGEAARYYFAREARDLTLSQAALLAAIIKGPNLYSPNQNPIAATERRDLVLELLRDQGRIDAAQYETALAAPLGIRGFYAEGNPAPHFVEVLRQELLETYGDEILESEGLEIHTTLDPTLQRQAIRALRDGLMRLERRFPALERPESPLEAALVAIAPATGEILALVGGRDYGRSQFNRATQARRQPGSVFKPVVALAALRGDRTPAFTLASRLDDEPLRVKSGGRDWEPVNYDGEFRGPVTLRRAVEQSLNVPIARLGLLTGQERIVETARGLGIESPLEAVPSLALGAFEVSLLEMTRTYAVFASGGVLPVLRGYADVVDEAGVTLERRPLRFERSFPEEETYLVTSVLRGVMERGTGRSLRDLGFRGPVAGKTGTTNDFRDAWFIGFTPELLIGVWVGFDDGASLGVPGSVAALPIFADLLVAALGPEGRGSFLEPPGLERLAIDPETGLRAAPACPGEPELFLAGSAPRERCDGRAPGAVERFMDWLRGPRR